MRVLSIGDVHGRTSWKEIIPNKFDKIIFIGDYPDSFNIPTIKIIENFKDIIEFKKQDPDKVELLLGNHDAMYKWFPEYRCAGFRIEAQPTLTYLYNENKNLFKISYQYKNYLWTHAGISNKWYRKHNYRIKDMQDRFDAKNLSESLNMIADTSFNYILNEIGPVRRGNRLNVGGPMWADRSETREDHLLGYHQICGHTPISRITTITNENDSITYIDCLGEQSEFYELNIID